ncbi:MAG: ABC transporter ATP-binding protein [Kiritimatiellae bacterium]|nr:ABC transporter ATP-binding protein [Kiritimatiellia bacterium]
MHNIQFSYDDGPWELNVDSFTLEKTSCVGILGPNGSGKSTLLRLAAGILNPVAGHITLKGSNLTHLKRRDVARSIGYLPQESPMLFDYTVDEVVRMGRYPHLQGMGLFSVEDQNAVQSALRTVGLEKLASRPLSHLSGGERRRALIASVLAQDPELMLLDEPTSGLDIHHAAEVFHVVRSLANRGIGILLVTHDLNLVSLFCDQLILMREGGRFVEGAPSKVLSEKNVTALYGKDFLVQSHPHHTQCPMVLPMGPDDAKTKSEGAI